MKKGELEKARRTESEMTKLEKLRRAAGLTQKELAARSGVSWRTISSNECGEYSLSTKSIVKIAEALGVSPVEFF